MAIQFVNPNFPHLPKYIYKTAQRGLPQLNPADYTAFAHKGAVVCGTAPSLLEPRVLKAIRAAAKRGALIIALKQAITLLTQRGIRVDMSVAMDPGAEQIAKTPIHPQVLYALASSCHPDLYDYLLAHQCRVAIFHSACGCDNEMALYAALFQSQAVMCGGYTVANRAVALAQYLGFQKITVAGVDFGWREHGSYYAAGATGKAGNAGYDFSDNALIDGRVWYSRPDMIASAVTLARQAKTGLVKIIGDSMAASLAKRDESFLNACARLGYRLFCLFLRWFFVFLKPGSDFFKLCCGWLARCTIFIFNRAFG